MPSPHCSHCQIFSKNPSNSSISHHFLDLLQKLYESVQLLCNVESHSYRGLKKCLLLPCFGSRSSGRETRVRNLTQGPVEVQIRVGSMLRKSYTLRPGYAETLDRSKIRDNYSARGESAALLNGNGEPYVWIHSSEANWATAKKQYLTLDDLKACTEVKICNDSGKGAFTVIKISR